MEVIRQIDKSEYGLALETALKKVEREFNVFLTIHDLRGRLHHSDGTPLLPGRNVHQHTCCLKNRYKILGWNQRCGEDCLNQSEQTADKLQKPFIKLCWKGLVELVVPIFVKEQHLLSILAGTFRHPNGISEEANLPEWFCAEYARLPLFDSEMLEELSTVLKIIGSGIMMREEISIRDGSRMTRKMQIYQFIREHAHEEVTLSDLAQAIGVSPSRVRHLVKELTKRNFKPLLKEERMLRASYLLQSTDYTLELIAETVGFKNVYYFNRVFKEFFGKSPGRFRRNHSSNV
jgi:AraC-like DNA-binding protein/ligand-binding sensor protein